MQRGSGRHHRSPVGGFGWAVAVCVLALSGVTPALASASPTTTTTTTRVIQAEPDVHAGELQPTTGPIGKDPTVMDGQHLTLIGGILGAKTFYNGDFADPFVVATPGSLYVYATSFKGQDGQANVPVLGIGLTKGTYTGRYLGDAMPTVPKWTTPGYQWAPAVWSRPDGTYVLYYSTPATISLGCLGTQKPYGCVHTVNGNWTAAACISRATSTSPTGPFVDNSSAPFVCPVSQGGAIDPSIYVENGTPWLLWKADGDCCGQPTVIYSQRLSPDGLSTAGPAVPILSATQPWEGGLVEGPSMVEAGGTHWLFYSANDWGTPDYSIGAAKCASVTGPCTKPLDHAWLDSADTKEERDVAPGGAEFFSYGGLVWIVHHALVAGQTGNASERRLFITLMRFPNGAVPSIAPRSLAAALALALVHSRDATVPHNSKLAYLYLLHRHSSKIPTTVVSPLLTAGRMACADFAHHVPVSTWVSQQFELAEQASPQWNGGKPETSKLAHYEAYLVLVLAGEYLCPQRGSSVLDDLRQLLEGSPAPSTAPGE